MTRVTVIDGQGGNLGRLIVSRIAAECPECELTCVGTNSIATANMMKGGKCRAATGENAAVVAGRRSDIIIGPIGIVIADALLGEVTENMAVAIGRSDATRILIPMNRCDTLIAGVTDGTPAALIDDAMKKLHDLLTARR